MGKKVARTTDKALKGAYSQASIVIMKGFFSLVYFSIMSRLLSPDDFGLFALITAVTTILTSLSEAGLGSAIIQRKNASEKFISTAFTLSLILGLVFSGILIFCSGIFSRLTTGTNSLSLAYKLMSIIILLQSFTNIAWSLYMRKLDFFKFGILQIGADLISYLMGIVMAANDFGFYAIVGAVICNQVALAIILILMKGLSLKITLVRSDIKDILGYGGWLTAAVITRNLTNEIDKIIIGRMLPIADLGALNRPQGFIGRISSQVNGVVDTVLFPILSEIQDDRDKISRGYLKITSLVVTISFIIGATISLGSKIIIDIFFGSQWHNLQPILAIFAFAMIMHGYSRVADSFFRSLGIVRRYFFARIINWIIIITFVIIGCKYGILGAAIALAMGPLVNCIVKFFMQNKRIGVSFGDFLKVVLRSMIGPFLLTIIASIVWWISPYGEYVGVCVFIALILLSMIFVPNIYSPIFKEVIVSRFVKIFK